MKMKERMIAKHERRQRSGKPEIRSFRKKAVGAPTTSPPPLPAPPEPLSWRVGEKTVSTPHLLACLHGPESGCSPPCSLLRVCSESLLYWNFLAACNSPSPVEREFRGGGAAVSYFCFIFQQSIH